MNAAEAARFDAVREENAAVRHLMAVFGVTVTAAKRTVDQAVSRGSAAGKGYTVSYRRDVSERGTSRTLTVEPASVPA